MSRIAELREIVSLYGTTVLAHQTDGPRSTMNNMRDRPDENNHVMITLDLDRKHPLSAETEQKLIVHLWFKSDVQKVYFTKRTHRLKVVFNCRSKLGAKQ